MRALGVLFVLITAPALAQELPAQFVQRLQVNLPAGFGQSFHQANGERFITEFLPPGETSEAWQQMITITGLHLSEPASAERPALNFALSIKDGYQAACLDSFSAYEQDAPKVPGAVDVFAGNLNCGKLDETGQSQAMTFLVIAGKHEIYTFQWAEQTAPWQGGATFNADLWGPRLQTLSKDLALCNVGGDQSVCVSD